MELERLGTRGKLDRTLKLIRAISKGIEALEERNDKK